MSRRKVPNAETAKAWLEAAEKSGLTRVEWCTREGVDARSLQCWRIALRRPAAAAPVEFVEWVPRSESAPVQATSLRLHVRDVVIEVAPGFSAESLVEALRAVRAC